jgi:hypothetical protein
MERIESQRIERRVAAEWCAGDVTVDLGLDVRQPDAACECPSPSFRGMKASVASTPTLPSGDRRLGGHWKECEGDEHADSRSRQ